MASVQRNWLLFFLLLLPATLDRSSTLIRVLRAELPRLFGLYDLLLGRLHALLLHNPDYVCH